VLLHELRWAHVGLSLAGSLLSGNRSGNFNFGKLGLSAFVVVCVGVAVDVAFEAGAGASAACDQGN